MELKEQQVSRPEPISESNKKVESAILIDTDVRQEVPKEVKTWLEEIEKDPSTRTIINPQNNQPILVSTSSSTPKMVLPITRMTFIKGFAKTIVDAGLWLSRYILRQIQIKKGHVLFKHQAE